MRKGADWGRLADLVVVDSFVGELCRGLTAGPKCGHGGMLSPTQARRAARGGGVERHFRCTAIAPRDGVLNQHCRYHLLPPSLQGFCKTKVPQELSDALEAIKDNDEAVKVLTRAGTNTEAHLCSTAVHLLAAHALMLCPGTRRGYATNYTASLQVEWRDAAGC